MLVSSSIGSTQTYQNHHDGVLGRTEEAISDFEAFLAWLDTQPEDTQTRYTAQRRAWIEALRSGRNPFDQETLRAMRAE